MSSAELATVIASADFSGCSATIVGYGYMGKQYLKTLRALGVKRIRVCSRSKASLAGLETEKGVTVSTGGFERLECRPEHNELGIVATPTPSLMAAAQHLVSLGFRRLLIEKPVSLWSGEIERLAKEFSGKQVEAICAYNRVAYASFHEVRSRVYKEGGITSCTYAFTEMIKPDWSQRFPPEELALWGIANSLHVIGMAHGLIGMPREWSGYRRGSLPWHPAGSLFVGAGISDLGIPFSYHADWGSTGRWSVEVHTSLSSYRLCPLEKLLRRTSQLSDWEGIPVVAFAQDVKAGIVEEVAAMLSRDIRRLVPLLSLSEAAALTRYAEDVLGYSSQ